MSVTDYDIRMARRTPLLFVGSNAHQMESFAIPERECLQNVRLTFYRRVTKEPCMLRCH